MKELFKKEYKLFKLIVCQTSKTDGYTRYCILRFHKWQLSLWDNFRIKLLFNLVEQETTISMIIASFIVEFLFTMRECEQLNDYFKCKRMKDFY